MKYKKILIIMIIISALFCSCNNSKSESSGNDEVKKIENNQNENKDQEKVINQSNTETKAIASTNNNQTTDKEAKYFTSTNSDYKKIGNARYNFWIDIPNEWKAFESSSNGDGYFIISDNDKIDIRVYGGILVSGAQNYLDILKGDNGIVGDFKFNSNIIGKQVSKTDSNVTYTCSLGDIHLDFYVNYEKDKSWFDKNKSIIQNIAKSLRSGDSQNETLGENSQDNAQESYFGQWIIKKKLAYGRVGVYGDDAINSMIGKEMSFSKEKSSCFGDNISYLNSTAYNPKYEKVVLSESKFEQENNVTFDQLGIKTEYIIKVNASDSKFNGCTFYIKDDNTLILVGGGVYLELDRK